MSQRQQCRANNQEMKSSQLQKPEPVQVPWPEHVVGALQKRMHDQ
jgi:hypothetical protein